MLSSTLSRFVLFLLLVGVGVGVHGWVVGQGDGQLTAEEQIYSQLATQIVATREIPPVYVPTEPSVGTAGVWLIAALLDSPLSFASEAIPVRLASVALFGLFLLAHGWLVYKLWGGTLTLLTAGLAAVPSGAIVWWTHRPVGGVGLVLALGTAALLLSQLRLDVPPVHYGRLLLLGLVLGVGLWTSPLILLYVAIIATLWLLRTPEWRVLYRRVPVAVWPLVAGGLATLAVVGLFGGGCLPTTWRTAAQLLLLAVFGWTAIGFGWVSQRMMAVLWQAVAVGSGLAVGSLPQWWAFFGRGLAIPNPLATACPALLVGRLGGVMGNLLPQVWGGAGWLSWLALPLMGAAVLYFLWHWWVIWGALLTLRPLVEDDVRILLPVLLVVLPLALAVFSGESAEVYHLLPFWQGGTMLAAWSVRHWWRPWPRAAVGVYALLVLHQLASVYWLAVAL